MRNNLYTAIDECNTMLLQLEFLCFIWVILILISKKKKSARNLLAKYVIMQKIMFFFFSLDGRFENFMIDRTVVYLMDSCSNWFVQSRA